MGKDKWLEKSKACLIETMNLTEEEDIEVLLYGLNIIVQNVFKLGIVLLIATVLKVLMPTVLCILGFVTLRTFAFGVHANTSRQCATITVIMFIGGAMLAGQLQGQVVIWGLSILNLLLLWFYAPADTESRPIPSEVQRVQLRKQAIVSWVVVLMVGSLILRGTLLNALVIGQLLECLCITPLTYKLLGKGYKNYENYNEATFE